jgi:hypothetical protein
MHPSEPEEDGVDEAGRTTQPPLIMAPRGLKTDPGEEATETSTENGSMPSPRTGSESPRPATTAKDTADSSSAGVTPLPADTVGEAKNGSVRSNGVRPADKKQSDPVTVTAAEGLPAVNGDRKPSRPPAATFAPKPESGAPAAATVASPAPVWESSARAETAYAAPSHTQPEWQAGRAQPTTVQPAIGETATASPAPAGPTTSANGHAPTGGFPSAAASAVTGAAGGLFSSVTSSWRNRSTDRATDRADRQREPKRPQVRRAAKRQAMLTLARVEPWSVMKFSFVASVVAFIILFVAVAVLYMVLSALGVFDSIQHTVASITSSKDTAGTNITHWFSPSLILGYTAMLGALNIVLITAISTIGSVIYNLIAKTIGGVEVTLRETD